MESEIKNLREVWLEHHVLSFPNQFMSDDDLERFTLYFGSFGDDPFIASIPGRKNIIAVKRTGLSEEEITKIIHNYDGMVVRSATKVTKNIISAAKNLKLIGTAGAGVDKIDVPMAREKI